MTISRSNSQESVVQFIKFYTFNESYSMRMCIKSIIFLLNNIQLKVLQFLYVVYHKKYECIRHLGQGSSFMTLEDTRVINTYTPRTNWLVLSALSTHSIQKQNNADGTGHNFIPFSWNKTLEFWRSLNGIFFVWVLLVILIIGSLNRKQVIIEINAGCWPISSWICDKYTKHCVKLELSWCQLCRHCRRYLLP